LGSIKAGLTPPVAEKLKSPQLFLAKPFFENLTTDFSDWLGLLPASWDWQKKSKNLASLLAEFLFLPCPIRSANAPCH
jgi:hypothetical protein